MTKGFDQQKAAVKSGHWLLYRYDPRRTKEGKSPLTLDSKPPSMPIEDYAYSETRYKMLTLSKPEQAKKLLEEAQQDVMARYQFYKHLAEFSYEPNGAK
jgi:pyruvate-ferredoxin/flavodoxin oxidoreductase